ncbi:MAG: hypothetical protein ACYDAP_05765 [Thermoplasmataceae archaeon]
MSIKIFIFSHFPSFMSVRTTCAISGSSIFSSIWTLVMKFFGGILSGILTLLNDVFNGIGGAIGNVFSNWGYSVTNTFGVWAPMGMIVVLGVTGFVLYIFIDLYRGEKDVAEDEADI